MLGNCSPDFLELIPIAYYRLDKNDIIVHVNQAWLDLRGYSSRNNVLGKHINTVGFTGQKNSHDDIRERVVKEKIVRDIVHELVRPDNSRFWGSIHAVAIYDKDGEYAGREGFVIDVTERETHRAIASTIPMGIFEVEPIDGIERIVYCNDEFVQMFGFSDMSEALLTPISQVYFQEEDYKDFLTRINQEDSKLTFHRQKYMKQIGTQGVSKHPFLVEGHTRIQRDDKGRCTRRVEILKDLRHDEPLQKLSADLGNVLHTFTTALIAIENDIRSAQLALDINPFKTAPTVNLENHFRKTVS